MKIFDEVERNNLDDAKHQSKQFEYLNYSGREEAAQCRELLERWFDIYPEDEKEELRARIRSNDDRQYQSAFFELFLYQLLCKMGCNIQIHPSMPNSTKKKPDFLVTSPNGDKYYLEATVATDVSEEESSAEARKNVVYDLINTLDSPNFFIGMDLEGDPITPPPGKKIKQFIRSHIENLDPDQVLMDFEARGEDGLPKWEYSYGDWSIVFFPIPKKPEARGKSGVKPIGLQSIGAKWINSSNSIRSSIEKKATRYNELEYPYIIAINALGNSVDRESVFEAVFGKEQITFEILNGNPVLRKVTRDFNGAWIHSGKPKNTRVSGVLIGIKLSPWSFLEREFILYLNPWAQKFYDSELHSFPRFIPENDSYKFYNGASLSEIFEAS